MEREGVELLVVGIAVLDQLEGGQAGATRSATEARVHGWLPAGSASPRRTATSNSTPDGDRRARRRCAGRGMHHAREDGPGGGLVHAGHLLHRLRRQRDLPAGDRAAAGSGQQPVQRVLDAIRVVERGGAGTSASSGR
jgi:hypothetical protein